MKTQIEDILPVFKEVFENEDIEITASTSAKDIEEWDSLNHIYLVVALEKFWGVKFTTQQIQGWTCVGDIIADAEKLKS